MGKFPEQQLANRIQDSHWRVYIPKNEWAYTHFKTRNDRLSISLTECQPIGQ